MTMKLRGKVALITGGSKGIGYGCARVFLRHGCRVVIASRNVRDGRAAERRLNRKHRRAAFVPCDVNDAAQLRRAIEITIERFGKLDCMVNNAGWHPPALSIDDTSLEEFERLLRLNLTSTFLGCKLALPHLRKTRGTIINMSSEVALIGQADACAYVTTKAGQVGLTKALALDLAPKGVRINAVCPAGVMTPLVLDWAKSVGPTKDALKMVDELHPIGRMATIDEIGEVCAFLASDEASFITGQAIVPDGGAGLGYRR